VVEKQARDNFERQSRALPPVTLTEQAFRRRDEQKPNKSHQKSSNPSRKPSKIMVSEWRTMKIYAFYQENHQKSSFLAKKPNKSHQKSRNPSRKHQKSWFPSGEP
jgi:hypothetical protein